MPDTAVCWDCYAILLTVPFPGSSQRPNEKSREERRQTEESFVCDCLYAHVWNELKALEEDWLDVGTFSVSAKVELSDCLL